MGKKEKVGECKDMKHIRQDESDHGIKILKRVSLLVKPKEIVGLTFALSLKMKSLLSTL